MSFIPASAFAQIQSRQLWVRDGVASSRRSSRIRQNRRRGRNGQRISLDAVRAWPDDGARDRRLATP